MMYAGYSRTDSKVLAKTRADVFRLLYGQISNGDVSTIFLDISYFRWGVPKKKAFKDYRHIMWVFITKTSQDFRTLRWVSLLQEAFQDFWNL